MKLEVFERSFVPSKDALCRNKLRDNNIGTKLFAVSSKKGIGHPSHRGDVKWELTGKPRKRHAVDGRGVRGRKKSELGG